MMFSAMLTDCQDCDSGFSIKFHFDGKLLNLRTLQAKSKVQTYVLNKLLYAYDMAGNAKTEIITKTSPCNEHPLTPHFYIVKLGFTGVYFFLMFAPKHRLWVLVRTASLRRF